MNWLLIGISIAVAVIVWYCFPANRVGLEKEKTGLLLMILLAGSGSILFQIYGYTVLKMVRYLILMAAMLLISRIDKMKMLIPNRILAFLCGIRFLLLIGECIQNWSSGYLKEVILSPVLGIVIGGGIFYLCYIFTRKSIGAGDVKLFAVIGFYVGPGVLFPVMLLASLLSAVYCILMVLLHRLKLTDSIPFGPFAAVGTIFTLLLGF